MELRPELMPPALDAALVSRLADLADRLDGARAGEGAEELAEFNRLAGTALAFEDFQGISGSERHETYVRRILCWKYAKPAPNVTREELVEVVRRAMPQNGYVGDHEAYMAVFDANVSLENASELIFYPLDYNPASNTWDGPGGTSEPPVFDTSSP